MNAKTAMVFRGALAMRADTTDTKKLVEEINKSVVAMQEAHKEYEAGVEKKFADVVTSDKLDKVSANVSELVSSYEKLQADMSAMQLGGTGTQQSKEELEYAAQYDEWFRTGDNEKELKAALKAGNVKAATSVGSDPDGGYAAPVEWDRTVTDKLLEVGQMRRHASVQTVSGRGFKKLYNLHGATSGWVGETAARPETGTPTMDDYEFSFGEIYANPAATQQSLEDPELDIAAWLAAEVNLEFQLQEGIAFISGDGSNKPKGILNYTAADEAALAASARHPLGAIGEMNSGVANSFDEDSLVKLAYQLPEERSVGAAYYANRTTHSLIRLLKDADGRYIWQPPFQAGQPSLVNGKPIHELDGVEDADTDGNIAVLYGNMAMTYRIFDRLGLTVMRDPFTNKPYVNFYTRKRVGGGLWNPEYMHYMKIGA